MGNSSVRQQGLILSAFKVRMRLPPSIIKIFKYVNPFPYHLIYFLSIIYKIFNYDYQRRNYENQQSCFTLSHMLSTRCIANLLAQQAEAVFLTVTMDLCTLCKFDVNTPIPQFNRVQMYGLWINTSAETLATSIQSRYYAVGILCYTMKRRYISHLDMDSGSLARRINTQSPFLAASTRLQHGCHFGKPELKVFFFHLMIQWLTSFK